MKIAQLVALSILFSLPSLSAEAEEQPYIVKTYASFAALKADTAKVCELISHDCEVCTVSKDNTFACSSVGTACEPKQWRCYERQAAPH